MKFTFENDNATGAGMARVALQHADPPGKDVWKTATVAEAYLYLGRTHEALSEYRRLLTLEAEAWKHQSASLQAGRSADKLGSRALAEELEAILTPGARRVKRIFVSYSHSDVDWLDRLKLMAAPYLRAAETELDLWEDTRLKSGQQWDAEIRQALD